MPNPPKWLVTDPTKRLVTATGEVVLRSDVDGTKTSVAIQSSKKKQRSDALKYYNRQLELQEERDARRMANSLGPLYSANSKTKGGPKKLLPLKRPEIKMTPVVPKVAGKPSTSYVVENGEIVAVRQGKKKKRSRNSGRLRQGFSTRSNSVDGKMLREAAAQNLGLKDRPDAARDWACYKDQGKFGSFPIHDAHGDESVP